MRSVRSVAPGVSRYPLDVRAEREAALLRMIAAILAIVGGAWLLALPFVVPRVLAVVGLVFAVAFLRRASRSRGTAETSYLEIGPDGICVSHNDRLERVAFTEMLAVSVDEDRLVVTITRRNKPLLELEPRYHGLTLHQLGSAIHSGQVAAQQPGCTEAGDG